MEHETTSRGRGVDVLLQGDEANATGLEDVNLVDEVADGAAEPVKPPHDKGVAVSGVVQQLGELGALGECAGAGVGEDPVAAPASERVDLHPGVLVTGGNAGVAQQRHDVLLDDAKVVGSGCCAPFYYAS